jgi:hypothetical protein
MPRSRPSSRVRCSSLSEQTQTTTRNSALAADARVRRRLLVARSSAGKSRIADWPSASCRKASVVSSSPPIPNASSRWVAAERRQRPRAASPPRTPGRAAAVRRPRPAWCSGRASL